MEVEEWNEYGELKENLKIVPIGGTPFGYAAATPTTTPSKAPVVVKENVKPFAELEEAAPPAPSSFTLAMRQAGQEAGQKAKDSKKKALVTLERVEEADPMKDSEKSAIMPPPARQTLWMMQVSQKKTMKRLLVGINKPCFNLHLNLVGTSFKIKYRASLEPNIKQTMKRSFRVI